MDRKIEFREFFKKVSQTFEEIEYETGDLSDIGNEIGFAVGKALPDLTEEEIKVFIFGIKHGISLTNGTH